MAAVTAAGRRVAAAVGSICAVLRGMFIMAASAGSGFADLHVPSSLPPAPPAARSLMQRTSPLHTGARRWRCRRLREGMTTGPIALRGRRGTTSGLALLDQSVRRPSSRQLPLSRDRERLRRAGLRLVSCPHRAHSLLLPLRDLTPAPPPAPPTPHRRLLGLFMCRYNNGNETLAATDTWVGSAAKPMLQVLTIHAPPLPAQSDVLNADRDKRDRDKRDRDKRDRDKRDRDKRDRDKRDRDKRDRDKRERDRQRERERDRQREERERERERESRKRKRRRRGKRRRS
ncbi:apoptotic chromatin condensation inducer in the nucleus-like, partial [Portunus trituberculatus]|uniref:apoptotic chromatin condensation inducer in the nucleus-like n=1 Tax=Portunus trituberculatus TaxID=210409 RepID=UPI001E1CDCF6